MLNKGIHRKSMLLYSLLVQRENKHDCVHECEWMSKCALLHRRWQWRRQHQRRLRWRRPNGPKTTQKKINRTTKAERKRKKTNPSCWLRWKTKPDHIHLLDVVGSLFFPLHLYFAFAFALCIALSAREWASAFMFSGLFFLYSCYTERVVVVVFSSVRFFFFFLSLELLILPMVRTSTAWQSVSMCSVQVFVIWTDWNSNQFFGKKIAL